jgi:hypothetical protein
MFPPHVQRAYTVVENTFKLAGFETRNLLFPMAALRDCCLSLVLRGASQQETTAVSMLHTILNRWLRQRRWRPFPMQDFSIVVAHKLATVMALQVHTQGAKCSW